MTRRSTLTPAALTALLLGALVGLQPGSALAVPIDIAVVHIGVDNAGVFGISNAINFLGGDARFASIANLDVDAAGVPTAAALSAYASLLVVTDNRAGVLTGGGLGTQLGNVLDDYVFGGGRVVLTTFAGNNDIGIDGDILGIGPYISTGINAPAGDLVLPPLVPHPVFDGIGSFSSTYASTIILSPLGIALANYNTGTIGVATVPGDAVMFVNGFPGNQSDYANGTDFGLLFANALALGQQVPEPGTVLLLAAGLLGWAGYARRKS